MQETIQHRLDTISKLLGIALVFFIPVSTTLTQILLLLILFCICVSGQWKESLKLFISHPVATASLGLFLIFSLGVIYSKAPLLDSLSMLGKMSKILYIPLLLPLFLEEKWRKYAFIAFIVAMVITLIISGLKTYHYLPAFIPVSRYHDCAFKNHIDTNFLMSMAVFFLAHYLFRVANRYWKVAIILILGVMTFYILWMSQGRTGYIIFSALWMLWLYQRMTLKQCVAGVSALVFILGVTYLTPSKLQQRISVVVEELKHYKKGTATQSAQQRLEFFQSSFDIIKQKPLLGFGTGSFKEAYASYAREHNQASTTNPHNEYLNILVQWGFLGFLAFMGFIGTVFRSSLRLLKDDKYWVQGVLFGTLVGSFGNSFLMDFTPGYFFVTFIAMTMAAMPLKNRWGHHGLDQSALLTKRMQSLQEGLVS